MVILYLYLKNNMYLKLFFSFILFLFISTHSNAFDIREVNNAKVMSRASYAINDTNLVDEENAEILLENVIFCLSGWLQPDRLEFWHIFGSILMSFWVGAVQFFRKN